MQAQMKQLMQQKDQMQAKLAQLETQIQKLNSTYNLQKGTVDAEGFPRSDLDFGQLTNYRNLKRQKAQLNNDYSALMKQIQRRLYQLHKELPDVDGQAEVFPTKQQEKKFEKKVLQQKKEHEKAQKAHNIDYLTPFAKISFVNPGSPVDKAGMKEGDLLSQFSQVNIYAIDFMKQIPKHVHQGKPIKVVVLRPHQDKTKGQNIFELKDGKTYKKQTIQVVPSMWAGKGLLGCKIDPLTE